MASIKDLKRRITTTKNTQQTTKALKMVSAAKLRRAQDAIINHRPYAKRNSELIRSISAAAGSAVTSPLLGRDQPEGTKKKLILVVVTSDRGLCAGFNANIIKGTNRWIAANGANYESVRLAFVGRRGYDFFKTKKHALDQNYVEVGGKVTFAKARLLADSLVEKYLTGDADEVKFIFNEFKNAVLQAVNVYDFLPVAPAAATPGAPAVIGVEEASIQIVKPDPISVVGYLLEKSFAIQTFRILLESQAGEHGARMSAMENATKNAGEMIRKLTLQYNKQRQASITKELLEIISGSESQKA